MQSSRLLQFFLRSFMLLLQSQIKTHKGAVNGQLYNINTLKSRTFMHGIMGRVFVDRGLGIVWRGLPELLYGQEYSTEEKKGDGQIIGDQEKQEDSQTCIQQPRLQIREVSPREIPRNKSWISVQALDVGPNVLRQSLRGVLHFAEGRLMDTSQPCLPSQNRVQYRKSAQLKQILQQALLLTCQTLLLNNNNNPQIPQTLQPILFPNLQTLNLSNNKLTSLDPLTYLHSPALQTLHLNNNLLTSMKSFIRIGNLCPELREICLEGNFVSDFCDGLARGVWGRAGVGRLRVLKLEMFASSRVAGQGLSWLLKCDMEVQREEYNQGKEDEEKLLSHLGLLHSGDEQLEESNQIFKHLYIESKKRIGIHTSEIAKVLRRKHPQLKIKSNIIIPRALNPNPFNF